MSRDPPAPGGVPSAEPAAGDEVSAQRTKRIAGLAWACAAAGILGGFLLGGLVGGRVGLEIDEISTIVEIVTGVPALATASAFLARKMGRRVRLPAIVRWGLAALAWSGGFLVGFGWLESGAGIAGMVLLACTLIAATLLSARRFVPAVDAEHEPTLEELVHGR